MREAAALLAMLVTVAATVASTRMRRGDGLVVLAVCVGVSLAVLYSLGAESGRAVKSLGPLLMLLGYAAIGAVLGRAGVTGKLARRFGASPVWVLLAAAGTSTVLSNDVVIVTFAPVVLLRRTWRIDVAALFVGANVAGGFLPQGSPTNLLVLGGLDFTEYLRVAVPVSFAMLAAAVSSLAAVWALAPRWLWCDDGTDGGDADGDAGGSPGGGAGEPDDNAAAYGIDPDQIVLVGWSVGGVSVIETLNDDYRTVEGFTYFPKVRVSLSGDWAFTQSIPMNTTNDPLVAQVYFEDDPTFMDDIYAPQFEENCASMSAREVPCTSLRLRATGHDLWLSTPDGSPGPWGGTITDCFDGTPVEGCSPLTQILPFAADASTPG